MLSDKPIDWALAIASASLDEAVDLVEQLTDKWYQHGRDCGYEAGYDVGYEVGYHAGIISSTGDYY